MNKNSINKKLVAVIAIVALVSILAICLVACNNQETFEKRMKDKDYIVVAMTAEQIKQTVGEDVGEIEWAIIATKGNMMSGEGDYVGIIRFKNEKDAKTCVDEALLEMENNNVDGFIADRIGSIIFIGTEQAVKDAK